jgi:hypothetical protein
MLAGDRNAEAGACTERDAAGLARWHGGHANGEAGLLLDVEKLPRSIDVHGNIAGGKAAVGNGR